MNTLVEDEELKRLRAMADGSLPFEESGRWEKVAALSQREFLKLDARTRLACGYYLAAQRRSEQMKGGA